jgi:hypothetical protein
MCLEVIILIFDYHMTIKVLRTATIPHLFILARHNDNPVLRIRDIYPGSEFYPSPIHPGSGSASKNSSILTKKIVAKLSEI